MNKYTLLIYAIIVGVAILSSLLKKKKKPGTHYPPKKTTTNYNQPQTTVYKKPAPTQPKSLEDVLQALLNEQKPPVLPAPVTEKPMVITDKPDDKYITSDITSSLENEKVQFYTEDNDHNLSEELVEYGKTIDHRMHGGVFGEIKNTEEQEQESEWARIDWRSAIITAEILKRPDY